jgi:hypothetical protein
MSTVKSYKKLNQQGPSTFALLVDEIRNMSASAQKLLWMQLNQDRLSVPQKLTHMFHQTILPAAKLTP